MKKRPYFPFLLVVITLLLAACNQNQANSATIHMAEMRFQQVEVQVKAGQSVTLHLVNQDGYAHAFDLDEFDLHFPLAAEETVDIVFTPSRPGIYTFYCGSPGHQAAGMVGTLQVES